MTVYAEDARGLLGRRPLRRRALGRDRLGRADLDRPRGAVKVELGLDRPIQLFEDLRDIESASVLDGVNWGSTRAAAAPGEMTRTGVPRPLHARRVASLGGWSTRTASPAGATMARIKGAVPPSTRGRAPSRACSTTRRRPSERHRTWKATRERLTLAADLREVKGERAALRLEIHDDIEQLVDGLDGSGRRRRNLTDARGQGISSPRSSTTGSPRRENTVASLASASAKIDKGDGVRS